MKAVIEGLLFLSGENGLSLEEISKIIDKSLEDTTDIIKELYKDYDNDSRGLQIEFLGNHFKLTTKSIHKEYYKKLVTQEQNSPLTQSALETLAIIAYNEPITRMDIDNIRGVNSTYVIRKLLLKGLIEDKGRSDVAGRPKLYGITSNFLDYFGLGSVEELPKVTIKEISDSDDKNLFESKYIEEN